MITLLLLLAPVPLDAQACPSVPEGGWTREVPVWQDSLVEYQLDPKEEDPLWITTWDVNKEGAFTRSVVVYASTEVRLNGRRVYPGRSVGKPARLTMVFDHDGRMLAAWFWSR